MLIATYLRAAEQAHGALTAWDQAAGDGDFGDNLRDGLRAAAERVPEGADLAGELAVAAEWFLDHVGGTSGPLFGLLFDAMVRRVRAAGGAAEVTDASLGWALVDGVADGTAAIQRVGEAKVGDRTMVDALVPAVQFLRSVAHGGAGEAEHGSGVATGPSARATSGSPPARAHAGEALPDWPGEALPDWPADAPPDWPGEAPPDWPGAARTALAHAQRTATIRARMGRASYLGERAIGTPDAGAMGVALLFWSLAATLAPGSEAHLPAPDALG